MSAASSPPPDPAAGFLATDGPSSGCTSCHRTPARCKPRRIISPPNCPPSLDRSSPLAPALSGGLRRERSVKLLAIRREGPRGETGKLTFGNALSVITVVAFLRPRSLQLLSQFRRRVGRGVRVRGRLRRKGIRRVEVVLQEERVRSGLGPEVSPVAQHARSSQHVDVVRRSKNTRSRLRGSPA